MSAVGLGAGFDENLLRESIAERRRRALLQGGRPAAAPACLHPRDGDGEPELRGGGVLPAARHGSGRLHAGDRLRERAVPPRLRRDEDEAASSAGDPPERGGRADPCAVACGPRLVACVDERREEPLGRRVAAVARLWPVLGPARPRAHASEEAPAVRHARGDRRGHRPRAGFHRRDRRRRPLPERPRREARRRLGRSPTARSETWRCGRPLQAATSPTFRSSGLVRSFCMPLSRRRPTTGRARRACRSPRASDTSRIRTPASMSRWPRISSRSRGPLRSRAESWTPTPRRSSIRPGETIRYHQDLWSRFIGAAMAVYLLDLLVRRVRIFDRKKTSRPTAAIPTRLARGAAR